LAKWFHLFRYNYYFAVVLFIKYNYKNLWNEMEWRREKNVIKALDISYKKEMKEIRSLLLEKYQD